MDLYGDSFKLQEMIDSDIRSELDELIPRAMFDDLNRPNSPTLTSLNPGLSSDHLESMDHSSLDNDIANTVSAAWINGSQFYGFNLDFETIGGLFVNPQTGIPINLPLSQTLTNPVISSTSLMNNSGGSEAVLPSSQFSEFSDNSSDSMNFHSSNKLGPLSSPISLSPSPEPQDNRAQMSAFPAFANVVQQRKQSAVNKSNAKRQQQLLSGGKSKNKMAKHNNNGVDTENSFPKPAYSYSCLIAMALKNSRSGSLPVNEIYNFMTHHFPYFKTAPNGWKNSVRHNLSLNKCFEKIEKPITNTSGARKGCLWAMNKDKISKMDEELRKWSSKNPAAILRSMVNPEKLEALERGELKNFGHEEEEDDESDDAQLPIVSSTEEEHLTLIKKERVSSPITVDSSSSQADPQSPEGLPSLENSIQLDTLELQKGLWEELEDDRLEFLGDSLSNSSLLNQPVVSTPSPNQISFVHCNYVYSPATQPPTNETVTSSTFVLSNQESTVSSTKSER